MYRRAGAQLPPKQQMKPVVRHSTFEISTPYKPPLDWPNLLAYYRSHQIAGVETVSTTTYERVIRVGQSIGLLRVVHHKDEPQLNAQLFASEPTATVAVTHKVRQMFDLDLDPHLVANCFRSHKFLDSLVKKYPGLRLARGWSSFETAVCTILGQLVSVGQARKLVQQLVEHYGERVAHPVTRRDTYLFPKAEVLAKADLAAVRTTQARKGAIKKLSEWVSMRGRDHAAPQDADVWTRQRLLSIAGIGPWSAEYICLRAYGDTDAFPRTDLILQRAIERHPDLDLETLRPWRSYVAVYLWRHYAVQLSKQKRKQT
jgi:AraC family transcriptional regulator of adaptative response / DNA-3-methyladenine glycosylase II